MLQEVLPLPAEVHCISFDFNVCDNCLFLVSFSDSLACHPEKHQDNSKSYKKEGRNLVYMQALWRDCDLKRE